MNLKLNLCIMLLLSGAIFGCSTSVESPRQDIVSYQSGERPDILSYAKPGAETMRQIKVDLIPLTKDQLGKLNAWPKSRSQNGLRWFVEEKPDTMRNGPWNTQLYVFVQAETNRCLRVALIDNNGLVESAWLNDKMLFVKVWFGRIAWTDFVLDTQTGQFAYIENGRLDRSL